VAVWVVELLNSAIEALADALSVERHPLLGRAKDLGSAAVMLSLVFAVGVWAVVLWP
jgi:diacylglycerol kinase (ATP)